jgi:NADPH:quinone reductase-like Zn-dependent oxidoreductase
MSKVSLHIFKALSFSMSFTLQQSSDWDHLTKANISLNSGDDIAGTIHKLGSDVAKTGFFKLRDRVAAFHRMMSPHGAYAEYAIAPAHTTMKLSSNISFEGSYPKSSTLLS